MCVKNLSKFLFDDVLKGVAREGSEGEVVV